MLISEKPTQVKMRKIHVHLSFNASSYACKQNQSAGGSLFP